MEQTMITPYGALVAFAALCAVLLLYMQRRAEEGRLIRELCPKRSDGPTAIFIAGRVDPLTLSLVCIPAAFVGARLTYCLIRADFYWVELGAVSVLRTWEGGFLLYGAALGALSAAALLAKRQKASVAHTLDELAAPGCLAICICRLAEGFTPEGVGVWLENARLARFPIAVMNEYGEWQLAVFMLEALVAALILVYIAFLRKADGERILRALLLYACCQIVPESLRMDSCLRIGFVRVSQVISAAVILGVTCIYAYRRDGMRLIGVRGGIVCVGIAVIGGLEWALDKTAVSNPVLYAVMAAVCAGLAVNALLLAGKRRA